MSIAVASTNDLPTATADTYATNEDTPLTVGAPGVLANDTDVDGDPLSAVLVSGPSHGTLALQPDGAFTYTPAADFFGTTPSPTRSPRPAAPRVPRPCRSRSPRRTTAPAATADAYATNEDTPLTVGAPGVLANDTDVDGDALSAVLVTGPAHGTLSLQPDGAFTYTPAADFFGAGWLHLHGQRCRRGLEPRTVSIAVSLDRTTLPSATADATRRTRTRR